MIETAYKMMTDLTLWLVRWSESLAIDEDRAIKDREMELWDLELAAHKGELEGALDAKILGIPLDRLGKADTRGRWFNV